MAKSSSIQKKTLNSPDEIRTFDKGKVELATVGSVTFGRGVFQPGWKWSECVKPLVNTEFVKRRMCNIMFPGGSGSAWPMARKWSLVRATSARCLPAMMHG